MSEQRNGTEIVNRRSVEGVRKVDGDVGKDNGSDDRGRDDREGDGVEMRSRRKC